MYAKLMMGAAAVLAAALFAYLGHVLIRSYGSARYFQGLAEGREAQWPQILSANAAAAKAALDARDRIIAAETERAREAARAATLIRRSDEEVKAYETSDAGHAACLDAGRVHAIDAFRAALFSAAPVAEARNDGSRPMPANAPAHPDGRQPQ
jgi:hypothetical protein